MTRFEVTLQWTGPEAELGNLFGAFGLSEPHETAEGGEIGFQMDAEDADAARSNVWEILVRNDLTELANVVSVTPNAEAP